MAAVANIASAIVFVALVAVLVKNKNTASVITAFGGVFTGSLKAAEG
jgi:hypothetical protein